jgi:hypothetical protein
MVPKPSDLPEIERKLVVVATHCNPTEWTEKVPDPYTRLVPVKACACDPSACSAAQLL